MYKFLIYFGMIFFINTLAFSQDFTFNSPPPATTATKKTSPVLTTPKRHESVSPENFRKNVKAIHDQSQNNLMQKTIQSVTKKTQNNKQTKTLEPVIKPVNTEPPAATPIPTTSVPNLTPQSPVGTSPSVEAPPALNQMPPPEQQSQPYTGFPTSTPSGATPGITPGSTNEQPESNGGWLKY